MKTGLPFLILIFLVSTATNAFSQQFNKRIVGYFTSWSVYGRNYKVPDIPAGKINFINYAFANIDNASGTIKLGDPYADIDMYYPGDSWDADSLRGSFHQLQILKRNNPHIKTLISIGGWTWSTYFSNIALTQQSRETFAASCVTFIQEYGFDGVDIDWEYPVSGGLESNITRPEDKHNFTLLLAELRSQLDNAGDYLLTIAAPSSPIIMENIEIDSIYQYVDWINIMTYDFHGPWGGDADAVTHFNSPLYITEGDGLEEPYHSYFNISAAVDGYLAHGVPPEKLAFSFPFYGRGYDGVPDINNGLFQTYTGPASGGTWEADVFDYWDLAENYINVNGYTSYWNNEAKEPWLYNPNTQKMITYDDPQSIEEKVNYLKSKNLGGAMFWEFSGDKYGVLLNALYENINAPVSVPESKYQNNKNENLIISPNPLKDLSVIRFNNPENKNYTLLILNTEGAIIQKISGITGNSIDLKRGNLKPGIYFIRLEGEKLFTGKLFVQ